MSERLHTLGLITSWPFGFSPATFSPAAGIRATLALVLLCFFSGVAAVSCLPLAVAAAALLAVVVIGSLTMGSRPFAVLGLVYSVPFSLMHHFVYRPNIGAADGLTVELIDLWMIWLLGDCVISHRNGRLKRVHGSAAFCVPLAVLLLADLLSFAASADIALSLYGFINHVRAAALFVILMVTLAQSARERRAASLGIVLTVLSIGGICVAETVLGANFRRNALVDEMTEYGVFRAAGLSTPTVTGGYLAALLPLTFVELLGTSSRLRRLLATVALCLGAAGLACTLTRGAWGCLLVGSLPLLGYLYQSRSIRLRHIIVCVGAAALVQISLGDRIAARLDEGPDTLIGRFSLIETALNAVAHHPIVGAGLNTYDLNLDKFTPKHQPWLYIVHNKFALTIAETGPLGLLAIVWLLTVALTRAVSLARLKLPLGLGLLCSIIVAVLDMNIETYSAGPALLNIWVLMAITAALWSNQWDTARLGYSQQRVVCD